ncbi:MAG: sulfite exporter TauE/SafE family protein [Rhodobacteraceae bacterium]|nr:sulfite exporter TauE/SafE family protein [Paracoccaceae bacterium]
MPLPSLTDLLLMALGLGLGGILKGATGAGSPVIGVPVLTLFFNVPMAVALFTIPNLCTNLWQGWRFRASQVSRRFTWMFAGGGVLGALVGSFLLAALPGDVLMGTVAAATLLYIAFRLARPGWRLAPGAAQVLSGPVGVVGGLPVSVTFLNAVGLPRPQFIATISVFFAMMSVVQIPTLAALGILTADRAALSLLALIPLFLGMPVGAWLARRISVQAFDRVTLAVLGLIAVKLIVDALG